MPTEVLDGVFGESGSAIRCFQSGSMVLLFSRWNLVHGGGICQILFSDIAWRGHTFHDGIMDLFPGLWATKF